MAIPDSQRYPQKLCLIKYEIYINVYTEVTCAFLLPETYIIYIIYNRNEPLLILKTTLSSTSRFQAMLRIRIRRIRKILASWIRIQGVKYQPKTAKNVLLLKSISELLKKEIL